MNSMRGVHPTLAFYAEYLIDWATPLGARLTSGKRSHAEQKRLYETYVKRQALFESGRGARPLPAAPPGKSMHEYGLAVDITANSLTSLNSMGSVWRAWGLTWGGAADPVHFEL